MDGPFNIGNVVVFSEEFKEKRREGGFTWVDEEMWEGVVTKSDCNITVADFIKVDVDNYKAVPASYPTSYLQLKTVTPIEDLL